MAAQTLEIIESHTGGEPTRVIIAGSYEFPACSMTEKVEIFQAKYDWIRRSVCNEPRGHDAMVGVLITGSTDEDCACGVIFFNNVGTLQMCVHGTIGLVATLHFMGKMDAGSHRIDTAVGRITVVLDEDGLVEVTNVASYRHAVQVEVDVPGYGVIYGDVAWGGNWFFLIEGYGPEVAMRNIEALTDFAKRVRGALQAQEVTGANGMDIDHIEVFAAPQQGVFADSQNFVLCPGNAYDRSPCGTGTSAKLACLFAAGKMKAGEIWRQAGILGSVFTGEFSELRDGSISPSISGRAWINGRASYFFDPTDPFRNGFGDSMSNSPLAT